MRTKRFISMILAIFFCFGASALTSCGEKNPSGGDMTTAAPAPAGTTAVLQDDTTATPADTASAPDDTTAASVDTTAEVTTEAEEEFDFGLNEYGKLEGADKAKLLETLPALLPDGTPIEDFVRPYCLDDVLDKDGYLTHYFNGGNSASTVRIRTVEEGAVFGTAFSFAGYGKTPGGDRGEVKIQSYYEANVKGARGIIFYIDFTHVEPDPSKTLCASVTLNSGAYRSNKANNGSVGYYYKDGVWTETKNVTVCRMALPESFAGWIYVPASSFLQTSDKTEVVDEQGRFFDINVESMYCFTDGYKYSADDSGYIIVDEIIYVY